MKIELHIMGVATIQEFADQHNLVMEVHERPSSFKNLGRFYATFKDCEVKGGSFLIGKFGDGETPEEAIADYAATISGETLVVDAFGKDRRIIKAPRLKPYKP